MRRGKIIMYRQPEDGEIEMKKVKIAFWLILVGLMGIVFWQNQAFFLEKKSVGIDYFVGSYQSPELQIVLYFLIFFLAGLLISYFHSLSERFVTRKTIKKLNEELAHAGIKISELEAATSSQQAADSDTGPVADEQPAKSPESSTP